MDCDVAVPVGIVVSREKLDHPWDEILWRPVSVLLDPPAKALWREVGRSRECVHYHAANLTLVLDRRCVMHYRVNLANGIPSLYVVVRQRPGAGSDVPIDVTRVSISPFEIDAHGSDASEHVVRVPMPPALVDMVQRFIDETAETEPRIAPRARAEKFGGGFAPMVGFSGQLSPGK